MPGARPLSPSEEAEISRAETHHAFSQVREIIAGLEAIRRTLDPGAPPADPRVIAAAILNADPRLPAQVRLVGPANEPAAVPEDVREQIAATRREFAELGLDFPDDVLQILVNLWRAQLLTPSVGRELVAAYRARAIAEVQAHVERLEIRKAIDDADVNRSAASTAS